MVRLIGSDGGRPAGGARAALVYEDVSFSYPEQDGRPSRPVLNGACLVVGEGEFCLVTGATGAGKTTLLRLAKPELAPAGRRSGRVLAFGRDVGGLDVASSAATVGFVGQAGEARCVCDSVWQELAFGLECLGTEPGEMRRRVAEVCCFLGIEQIFHERCDELSGGQRQLVSLAAVLAMGPRVLVLDEPTASLDPIARGEVAHALFRLNRELGITVVASTHEPWALAPYATRAVEVRRGAVVDVPVHDLGDEPELAPSHACGAGETGGAGAAGAAGGAGDELGLEGVWQRYARDAPWVLRDLSLRVRAGAVGALVGGNGSGKSTVLAVAAGVRPVARGTVGNPARRARSQVLVPQDPEALLSRATVLEELMAWSGGGGYGEGEARAMAGRLGLEAVLGSDPFELSRGQRQLVALAKALLPDPALMLLDEPTAGLDLAARRLVAQALLERSARGRTTVMATHDLALARATADDVSLMFDGGVACTMPTGEFFSRNVLFR